LRGLSILSGLGDDQCFFSIDEYGPFTIRFVRGRKLCAPGVIPSVPQWQKGRGTLIITGALELRTNQITHFYSEKKNTDEMIKMVEILPRQYKSMKRIYISWDAAGWHISKALGARVEFLNGWAAHDEAPTIELAPLPSRAQFLNVIASVFGGMSRAVIHNSNFKNAALARDTIDRYFFG
jgi:DDE superfamily endonuclease